MNGEGIVSPYAVLSLVMTNSFVAQLLRADPDNVRRISPGPPTTGEASGTMRAAIEKRNLTFQWSRPETCIR
jgi:hypothetical protein